MQTCFNLLGVQAPAARESFFGVVFDSRLAGGHHGKLARGLSLILQVSQPCRIDLDKQIRESRDSNFPVSVTLRFIHNLFTGFSGLIPRLIHRLSRCPIFMFHVKQWP